MSSNKEPEEQRVIGEDSGKRKNLLSNDGQTTSFKNTNGKNCTYVYSNGMIIKVCSNTDEPF